MADRITWADRADGTGTNSAVNAAIMNEIKAVAGDHADEIEANAAAASTQADELDAAEAAIAALQAVDVAQADELDAVEAAIASLETADTAQTASLAASVAALEAVDSSQSTGIAAAETAIAALETADTTQAAAIASAETAIAALEGVDTAQAASIASIEAGVSALEAVDIAQGAALGAQASEIDALEASVTALQGVDTTQAAAIAAVEVSVTALGTSKAAVDHDAAHVLGGSDELDGDHLGIDYTPSNYTPTVVAPATDADHLTAHLAGVDAALASAGGDRFQALSGLASDAHLSAPTETLGGDATTGLLATALIRAFSRPTGDQLVMAVARQFLTVGGYLMGLDGNRFRFGIAQDSDGGMLSNFINAELPEYEAVGRLFLLTLSFDGTTATGRVNAQDEVTLTPSGGYREPSAVVVPYIGRNDNDGAPLPATGIEWLGGGYAATPRTRAQTEAHWLACMEASGFVDMPDGALDSWWSVDGATSVPATLADQGSGGVTLTVGGAGTLTLTDAKARF